jgi:MFS family permease
VILANALLGINQGLAWSMSVNAKIDLVGSARRGLAVGLDEAGGYGGVAVAALVTGYLAGAYGLRPAPFIFGALVIGVALLMSILLMEETLPYALAEGRHAGSSPGTGAARLTLPKLFRLASFQDRTMLAINQAGAIEKFVDALVWVALPLYLAAQQLPVARIGEVVFVYGLVWGLGQVGSGHLADRVGRKIPIATGMAVCAVGVLIVPVVSSEAGWVLAAGVTGLGMALLYPNLMTAAADASPPALRASGLGVYRFWRDLGYAVGAIFIGVLASAGGLPLTFYGVAIAMGLSAAVLVAVMKETRPPGAPETAHG